MVSYHFVVVRDYPVAKMFEVPSSCQRRSSHLHCFFFLFLFVVVCDYIGREDFRDSSILFFLLSFLLFSLFVNTGRRDASCQLEFPINISFFVTVVSSFAKLVGGMF